LYGDRSTEEVDEALHDVEAEPDSAVTARRRAIGLSKRLEDDRSHLGRDANAGVSDHNLDAALARPDAYADPTGLGELHRVIDEVLDHHLQLQRISGDDRQPGRQLPLEAHTRLLLQLAGLGVELAHELSEPHFTQLHL